MSKDNALLITEVKLLKDLYQIQWKIIEAIYLSTTCTNLCGH